ncbi:SprA family protein [Aminivibrio pyruvatiphilus]|jgi:hypothetical protein|uniref:SprA family protein n=1 Tax=Aminivibrio pyruvatiphilus TaxID=1005740 RepID=A0A4V3HGY5_9BACT|nr:putative metalloprotease CJM1_0395 family protein [Aminivibrio pyruvatiphilus]TDY63151.1 SprA family protein [Aminivibrio pyruvatiphilus]
MSGIGAVTPVNSIQIAAPVASQPRREGLRRAEQEVLRQEMALRNSGDVTSTVYHFSVGPDGKTYITGATVTVRTTAEEEAGGKVPDAGKDRGPAGRKDRDENTPHEEGKKSTAGEEATAASQLKAIERDVIAHEAAHKAVGGQFAGPVSYSYATGADGRRYIVGGEVSISAPEGKTPEETIRIMEQVKRAALAPGSPSPQDLRVAAAASAAQMRARAEMAKQDASRAYSGTGNGGYGRGDGELSLTA